MVLIFSDVNPDPNLFGPGGPDPEVKIKVKAEFKQQFFSGFFVANL